MSLGRIAAFPSFPIQCQRAEVFSVASLFSDLIRFRTDKQLISIVKDFDIVGVVLTLLDLLDLCVHARRPIGAQRSP